jgi:hypothetical protein
MKIDPNLILDHMPVEKLSAYRVFMFASSLFESLGAKEILSINPDDEIFQTLPDGKKRYGWRYKPEYSIKSSTEEDSIVWLPDYAAPVAQNLIRQLQELTMSCNEFMRICAEASMRSFCDISSHSKAE